MRPLFIWITALILIATTSVGWYISLPVVFGFSHAMRSTVSGNQNAVNIVNMVGYATVWWGPLMIIFIFLWAVISSQKRDIESELYG